MVLLAGTVLLAKVPTERALMTMEMRMALENMVNGRGDSGTGPEVWGVGGSWWWAAQRLRKPMSVPRLFYRFGEPVDIKLRLTVYDRQRCTLHQHQTRPIYIRKRVVCHHSRPPYTVETLGSGK